MTEALTRACGADPAVLRETWEGERLREYAHRTPPRRPVADRPPAPSHGDPKAAARMALKAALSTLHLRAGRPDVRQLATATDYRLTQARITALLTGTDATTWDDLRTLVDVLAGDRAYFRPLYTASTASTTPAGPEPATTPDTPDTPQAGLEQHEARVRRRRVMAAEVARLAAASGDPAPDLPHRRLSA